MSKQRLAMTLKNLQTFAEGGESGAGENSGANQQQVGEGGTKQGDPTTPQFKAPQSQSELDSLTNKAVQKALENYKKGEADRIAEALKREKDYSQLSDAERAKKEFEDQQSAFAEEKAAFEHEKLVVQIEKDLVTKGLPSELAGTFAAVGNADEALKNVGVFENAFNKAVADKVKENLRQATPGTAGGVNQSDNYGASLASKATQMSGKII